MDLHERYERDLLTDMQVIIERIETGAGRLMTKDELLLFKYGYINGSNFSMGYLNKLCDE